MDIMYGMYVGTCCVQQEEVACWVFSDCIFFFLFLVGSPAMGAKNTQFEHVLSPDPEIISKRRMIYA